MRESVGESQRAEPSGLPVVRFEAADLSMTSLWAAAISRRISSGMCQRSTFIPRATANAPVELVPGADFWERGVFSFAGLVGTGELSLLATGDRAPKSPSSSESSIMLRTMAHGGCLDCNAVDVAGQVARSRGTRGRK